MLLTILTRLRLLRPLEAFLVRWFDFSIVSRQVCKDAGVAPVSTFTLTTVGRRSGDLLSTPLFYFRDGDSYIVVGSVGGRPKHPSWIVNLQRNPQAWVHVKRRRRPVRAEFAEGEERARLWGMVSRAYPPYDEYQDRARPREIPIVRLRPTG